MPRTKVRNEFLSDIIVAAVEGGTGYWASVSEYRWENRPPEDIYALLMEEQGSAILVNVDLIASGIGRVLGSTTVSEHIRAAIKEANRENDGGLIDSDAADVIVQMGYFGEVVYG